MKNKITILVLALLSASFTYAIESTPDSMYIHFTGSNGDSIAVHAIADVDSIVYYAPPPPPPTSGTFTDSRDSKTYKWVTIGEQDWMAENLNVTVATVDSTGGSADNICQTNDVFVWDNTDASYGKLYSWQAALKACPSGWHLPTDAEWTTLTNYLSGSHSGSEGTVLKSTTGWNGNGTDTYGFTALPGGYCKNSGTHNLQGYYGYWWSSTPNGSNNAYYRNLDYNNATVRSSNNYRYVGFSVRCVRD